MRVYGLLLFIWHPIPLLKPLINEPENPLANNQKPSTKNYICRMEVTGALVDKLAHLSRLEFNAAEKEEIKYDLQRMISFVEKLDELDLEGTEPLLHMSENVNVLRDDEVKGSITREEALKNAPAHDDKFFKVPKVIKK
jgi:aspartyl-tRNA(Asn)/glutamyl-tRNA(Gln) amidotransferase subunit C